MPFESDKQRKAMYAAAAGKSNIGIPKSVGEKFIKHAKDEADLNLWLLELFSKEIAEKEAKKDTKQAPALLTPPQKWKKKEYEDSEAWQTKEGKNKNGGLNEKGRESYNKEHGAHLKAPQPEGGSRKASFCARMKGMKEKLTSSKTAHDPNSRINKSLRKWKCDEDTMQDKLARLIDAISEYAQTIPDEDPCWEGYHQIGMKEKGGKEVPNCVPDEIVPRFGEEKEDELMVRHGEKQDSVTTSAGDPYEEIIGEPAHNTVPVNKMAGAGGRASGILFLTNDGKTLLIRRGDGGDFPKTWCVPGGHQNHEETLEECARREAFEEIGYKYEGELEVLYDDGQFCTYIARNAEQFPVKLNYESTGYDWCSVDNPDLPLHPGLLNAMKAASAKTEYDMAKLISESILPSPQMFANIMLLAIRITGTGLAYRSSIGEHVWRDPSLYLNQEFLNRCNGLIVIMDHPETAVLTTKEFKNRAVGSIILPYIQGDEVWGIAKIYDQDAMKEISEGEVSTSPSVVFDNTAGNTTLTTESGEPLLIEGVPFLLDHIAIVTKARGSKGVWDKGGDPAGVLLTNPEVSKNE